MEKDLRKTDSLCPPLEEQRESQSVSDMCDPVSRVYEGGRSPLLHSEVMQDISCPPLEGGPKSLISRRWLNPEEIAQGVDSGETLPVPLRDDMVVGHPELDSGSIKGGRSPRIKLELIDSGSESGMTYNREANALPAKSLPCERGGRSSLLDSETTPSIKGQTKLDRLRWRDLEEQSPLEFPPLARGAKAAFTLAEGRLACTTMQTAAKAGFTLAEVLITLAIIGVVAALTIPSLIENHNEKAWSTAKDLWQKKLVEVTRQMNIDGVMTGVSSTTEDFMDYLKKYVKVIKLCDNSKLNNCYSPKIVNTAGFQVDVKSLKSSKNLGHEDWDTNTMGFVISDGTTVIMAYNPNCDSVDPFSKDGQNGQVGCMSMLIDVNGKKGPNMVGKDILLSNSTISRCDISFNDLCLAGSDLYPTTAISTCIGSGNEKYDDRGDHQYCGTNYWAGAKKACDELEMRLPTMQELGDIATYIYEQEDNPLGATGYINTTPNAGRAASLSWNTSGWGYWSSESKDDDFASYRGFYSSNSYTYRREVNFGTHRARCVAK